MFRQVGGGEKGLFLGSQNQIGGPSAAAGHHLAGGQVGGVDIRAFFPIDLDGDEVTIENVCNLPILEAFVSHDVAPVAGRVADGEEDGLFLRGGSGEGRIPPGIPADGIFRVLQQVGALLENQAVVVFATVGGKAGGIDSRQTIDGIFSRVGFHHEPPGRGGGMC